MIWYHSYSPPLLQLQACSFFKHGNSNKSVRFAAATSNQLNSAAAEQATNTTSLVLRQNNSSFFTEAAAKPSSGILKVRQSLFRYVEKHKQNCFCWPKHQTKKTSIFKASFWLFQQTELSAYIHSTLQPILLNTNRWCSTLIQQFQLCTPGGVLLEKLSEANF